MKRTTRLGPESGQSTTEYILLLMIIVIITLSLVYQFNTAFRSYAEAFFDGYIACLLEVGELPGTGSVCQGSYAAFNAGDGTRLVSDEINMGDDSYQAPPSSATIGPSGGSGGGGGSGSASGSSGSGANAGTPQATSEAVGGSGESGGGSSTPVGRASSFGRSKTSSASEGEFKGTPEEAAFAGADALLGAAPTSVGNYGASGRTRRLATEYGYYGEAAAEERSQSRPAVAAASKQTVGNETLKPKKAVENLNRAPAQAGEEEGEGFTFGGVLRLLLIAGIIIAIVVFFGGQIMQISKSWEK